MYGAGCQAGGQAGAGGSASGPHAGSLTFGAGGGAGGGLILTAGNGGYSGYSGPGGCTQATTAVTPDGIRCEELASYYDVPQSYHLVNEAGGSGRAIKFLEADGDTKFRCAVNNDFEESFFKSLRGRFYTPARVFIGSPAVDPDVLEIEVALAFPEAIAKCDAGVRQYWASHLGKNPLAFYKVLFWDLWTWEGAADHYHAMYCTLDDIK